jgi:hypothetical protein
VCYLDAIRLLSTVLDLFPEFEFRDNLRPSQVTQEVRAEMTDWERRARNRLLLVPLVIVVGADVFLFSDITAKGLATLPWWQILLWQALGAVAAMAAIFWFYGRRIKFLQSALVTPAAVMQVDRTSLWVFGAGNRQRSGPPARNVREAVRKSDLGQYEYVPHIVRASLRFVPGTPGDALDWDALRDEVPHQDVTKWMSGGGWGTFAGELKQGSLVSLLYSPENPRRCRIVKGFRSHQRRPET